MRALIDIAIAIVIALGLGMGSVWYTVGSYDALAHARIGPWDAAIVTGVRDANPYMRAILARTAATPLPATEALVFHALTDSAGRALQAECTYRIASAEIETRWWTLSVSDKSGRLVANPLERYALSSYGVLRNRDGSFEVVLAPSVRAGNWLPSPPSGPIRLKLALYDTRLYTNGGLAEVALPSITPEGCQ